MSTLPNFEYVNAKSVKDTLAQLKGSWAQTTIMRAESTCSI
jgi:hypothetical protein